MSDGLSLAALAVLGFAWGELAAGAEADIVRAARSPYELARYIESHQEFDWLPLEKHLGTVGGGLLRCHEGGECLVELITVLEPRQTILVVKTPDANELVVRYFGDEIRGWRRAGAEVFWIKNYLPRHAIARVGRRPFLLVSAQGASGSGVSSENEQWFDLTRPDFKPVFGFQPQGVQSRLSGIGRQINSFTSTSFSDGVEAIRLHSTVRYSIWEVELGQEEVCATYERKEGETDFRLRSASKCSIKDIPIPTEEFESLMEIYDDGPTNEQLLKRAFDGLKKVAVGRNEDDKDAVRDVLEKCQDTPEKRELLRLLSKK